MRALLKKGFDALPPVRRLRRALAAREEAIEGLKRNLAGAIQERDAYCGHLMRVERARTELEGHYTETERARQEMEAHARRLAGEREELIAAVAALQAELEDTQKQVEALRGQRDELEQERNELKQWLVRQDEEISRLRQLAARAGAEIPVAFPNGHFYSPVVDPSGEGLRRRLNAGGAITSYWIEQANGAMKALYERLSRHRGALSFLGAGRYQKSNPSFWPGDAWVLAAMTLEFRPKRVVEAGCGHSSCVLIDVNERLRAADPMELTFIEPHPETLHGLLEPGSPWRKRILACGLEEADPSLFDALESGDILFLDTSHVVKPGGEVAYALNEILPRLRPGVLVHIHDIFAGWEYPADWVLKDHRSWNEIYMVRLLVEQGRGWRVEMFNDLCAKVWGTDEVAGSSLWLRKAESDVVRPE